jgi:hypothetical protein
VDGSAGVSPERFRVVRRAGAGGHVVLALVRERIEVRRLARDRWVEAEEVERRVVNAHHRDELATCEALLELAARYAGDGKLGCFVTATPSRDGSVRVALYDRTIGETTLPVEIVAQRTFSAEDEDAVAAAAGFAEELREWAARRNEVAAAARLDATLAADVRAASAAERERLAHELAAIIERAGA